MNEMINTIFQVCIIPLLGVLTLYFTKWVRAKSDEIKTKTDNEVLEKYIGMLTDTITSCVVATNQTYVNSLKEKNLFDADAQKEAFNRTKSAVLSILSEDVQTYLSAAMGDLDTYIEKKIEEEVCAAKLWGVK